MPVPGKPVPPLQPVTAEMARVASFTTGKWNGRDFDKSFIKQLYDNFQRFSSGPAPYYSPYLNLNHDDQARFGRIAKAELGDNGHTLYLYADQMPVPIAAMVSGKQFTDPSIEFIEPTEIDGQMHGFTGPDGKIVQGPVLKCLSLLGSKIPASKGMPQLPTPTFSQLSAAIDRRCVRRFACGSSSSSRGFSQMDLKQQLQQLGFNMTLIPPDATDELLQEILRCLQAANQNPSPVTQNADDPGAGNRSANQPGDTSPNTATSGTGGPGGLGPIIPATTVPPMADQKDISKLTIQFADQVFDRKMGPILGQINRAIQTVTANQNRILQDAEKRAKDAKEKAVKVFVDRMASKDHAKVYPHTIPSITTMLMGLDDQTVKTFADGRRQGTALQEMMDTIEFTWPKLPNAPGNATLKFADVNPAPAHAAPAGGVGVNQASVDRMLGGSPEGRAALKRRADTATRK